MPIAGMNVDTGQKTWLTPPKIIEALGTFDLDPCCPPTMPWRTAAQMVHWPNDGLKANWTGKRVWLNPPYGRESIPFLKKMAEHKNGIALLFGRTDTFSWHEHVFPHCYSVMFMRGRIRFLTESGIEAGSANAPSCLVAFSIEDHDKLSNSGISGFIMKRSST